MFIVKVAPERTRSRTAFAVGVVLNLHFRCACMEHADWHTENIQTIWGSTSTSVRLWSYADPDSSQRASDPRSILSWRVLLVEVL